jgi:hypothetical protein
MLLSSQRRPIRASAIGDIAHIDRVLSGILVFSAATLKKSRCGASRSFAGRGTAKHINVQNVSVSVLMRIMSFPPVLSESSADPPSAL